MLIPVDVEVDLYSFSFFLAGTRNPMHCNCNIIWIFNVKERQRAIFTVSIWIYFQWNLNTFEFFVMFFFDVSLDVFVCSVCKSVQNSTIDLAYIWITNVIEQSEKSRRFFCFFGSFRIVCRYALCSLNENTIYTTNRWRYTDSKNGLYNSVCQMNANQVVILYWIRNMTEKLLKFNSNFNIKSNWSRIPPKCMILIEYLTLTQTIIAIGQYCSSKNIRKLS